MISRSRIECFGLPLDGLSSEEILNAIQSNTTGRPYWIVTANPEILLYAKRDPSYKETLGKANLRIVDSIGLKLFGLLQGKNVTRTTGVDLSESLVAWAHETGQTVAFLGGDVPGSAARAFVRMADKHTGLKGITEDGGTVSKDGEGDTATDEALHRIILQSPDILLVAFGHPKQERWIEKNIANLPSVKVVMGVGGTIFYWSGVAKRPPKWVRSIGFEWLYRLITQPKRWKRILDAVLIFPFVGVVSLFRKRN